jgi:HlyD family secretion protein
VDVGAPLFRIDTRDIRAAQESATARRESAARSLDAARTQLTVAQNQLALFTNVKDPRAVSRLEVIDRQGVVANARAQVELARAQLKTAEAEQQSLAIDRERRTVRAPLAAQVLQVKTRVGEYASSAPNAGDGTQDPLVTLGVTEPLYVRIDIDENEIERVAMGKPAVVSSRGNAAAPVTVTFVRAEPQVVPKRSLTNSSSERVDVRVLQLIYALPANGHSMFVGQQVDAFVPSNENLKSGAAK